MADVSIETLTATSITARLADLDTTYPTADRSCDWYLDGVYKGGMTLGAYASQSASIRFSGLTPGTQYTVKAVVYAPGWAQSYAFYAYPMTPHLTPTIVSFSATQFSAGSHYASCVIRLGNLEDSATYTIKARVSGGSWYTKETGYATTSFTSTIEFDAYTTYEVRLTVTNATGYTAEETVDLDMTVEPFAWTYPKTKGGAFNLTAEEWNGLWIAIEERKGYMPSHTIAYPGNTFTAAMYKQAVDAIGAGTQVSPGDTITAALMNELVTNVNNM